MKNKIFKYIHDFLYRGHPRLSYLYGITDGVYKGTSIVFFDMTGDIYSTLAFGEDKGASGGMRVFDIPKKSVDEGFKNNIIQKIKPLPKWLNHIFQLEYKTRLDILKNTPKDIA